MVDLQKIYGPIFVNIHAKLLDTLSLPSSFTVVVNSSYGEIPDFFGEKMVELQKYMAPYL